MGGPWIVRPRRSACDGRAHSCTKAAVGGGGPLLRPADGRTGRCGTNSCCSGRRGGGSSGRWCWRGRRRRCLRRRCIRYAWPCESSGRCCCEGRDTPELHSTGGGLRRRRHRCCRQGKGEREGRGYEASRRAGHRREQFQGQLRQRCQAEATASARRRRTRPQSRRRIRTARSEL